MTRKALLLLIAVAFAALAPVARCSEQVDVALDKNKKLRSGPGVFSYDNDDKGPTHWGALKPEFQECSDGTHQSPINVLVDSSDPPKDPKPSINLERSVVSFAASSNNFQFNCHSEFANCSSIVWNKTTYSMLQVHAHCPSEHHLGGKPLPLEVHFVHKSADNKLLVFGVFFEMGDEMNPHFETLLDSAGDMDTKVVDLSKFNEKDSTICTYDGSLTTPPCSEGVRWVLSTKPMKASMRQIGEFHEMLGERTNNRPIQPITDRKVKCWPNLGTENPLLKKIFK